MPDHIVLGPISDSGFDTPTHKYKDNKNYTVPYSWRLGDRPIVLSLQIQILVDTFWVSTRWIWVEAER